MVKNLVKKKRGISGIIVAIILVALTLVLSIIVWGVVNNIVSERVSNAESCVGVFGQVTINNYYTCFNSSSNHLQFSVNVADIEVDEIVVSVSEEGATSSYILDNGLNPELLGYGSGDTKIPKKNSGKTYLTKAGTFSSVDVIKLAPVINDEQCEVSDTLSKIDDCTLLIS